MICLHRISDNRVLGEMLKHLRSFKKLCKDENIVFTTTIWDDVLPEVGEAREVELANNLGTSRQIHRFLDTPTSAWRVIDSAVSGIHADKPIDYARASSTYLSSTSGYGGFSSKSSSSSLRLLGKQEGLTSLESIVAEWETVFRSFRVAIRQEVLQKVTELAQQLDSLRKSLLAAFHNLLAKGVELGRRLRMIFTFCSRVVVSPTFLEFRFQSNPKIYKYIPLSMSSSEESKNTPGFLVAYVYPVLLCAIAINISYHQSSRK